MSNLVYEILLRLAKAGAAALLGLVLYLVLTRTLLGGRVGGARPALLAEWRGVHPARGDEPDLSAAGVV